MGRRKEHLERVQVEAYCWDVFKPVEMVEIDSMEKLDDAFRLSVECFCTCCQTCRDHSTPLTSDSDVDCFYSSRIEMIFCLYLCSWLNLKSYLIGIETLYIASRMASWCQKCIYLMPRMEKIAGQYPGLLRPYSCPSLLFILLSGSICAAQNLALCFILEYACF